MGELGRHRKTSGGMSRRNILRAGSIAGLSAAAVPVLGGTAFAQPGRGQNRLSTSSRFARRLPRWPFGRRT
ncbi:hypothetical protein [Fodinicola feengrottensis]|uniref:hypothetical protein n=1 Tax=Fodinicola feengrottensis TaxID=435914 RepID=UPI0024411B7D|nr:hypothetical protein [Fodinicola feengrottensis]